MSYSNEDVDRFEVYEKAHLRKKADLPDREKITELQKKLKGKWFQFFLNIGIIVIFLYMFINDYTTFPDFFYYFVFALFVINIGLIFLQRRQIEELISYIQYKIDRGISSDHPESGDPG